MAIGPLESFVFPGVYTRTINESSSVSGAGDIRFPAIIGTSAEELRVSAFEMVRGSSAIADNLILDENVSDQFTGTEKIFVVENYPIVTGDGSGTPAKLPQNVIVTVNDEAVAVNSVDGLNGLVTLVQIPKADDVVRANYYFKRRDKYIENENISDQADGSNVSFKVHSNRIVKGDNGGRSATNDDINATVPILYDPNVSIPGDEFTQTVRVIEVKVNGVDVTINALDGSNATFELASAPAAGSTVLVTYFTNEWQNTYDILPAAQVSRLSKVGLSQDTSDYSVGTDCVLAGQNRVHWGHSYQKETGLYTAGSNPLADDVLTSITDTLVYGRVASPQTPATDVSGNPLVDADGNELNQDGNKVFELPTTPVDGSGTGKFTENPNDITVYVGATWSAAKTAGAVKVLKIEDNRIYLSVSPSQGLEEKVYATYYETLLIDDTWTITNEVPGGVGTGKYTVSSQLHGDGLDVVQSGGTVTPVYAGASAVNTQVDPLNASVERVTITFNGLGAFTVTSKIGPAFSTNGRTGSVTTNNANKGYNGRTYIDPTTGFRVTFSDNTGLFNPGDGDTLVYDIGDPTTSNTNLQKYITVKTDIVRVIPGMNLTVQSTDGGTIDNTGDTVVVYTYNKGGNEPSNGDNYYVTFDRVKTDYRARFLTNMRDVIRYYGPIQAENRVTVAANLAFLNGARAVAIRQVQKTAGESDAPVQSYIEAIDEFNEPLPNGTRPSLIQPLSTDAEIHSYLKNSNAIQSSIRYRNERTSIVGFGIGTSPDQVIQRCRNLKTEKVTPVYPDQAIMAIPDAFGNEVEYIVDGSMIAAALAGRDVSPVTDIATTLTNSTIVGFRRLNRNLDNVTASLVAQSGCTVLEYQQPVIRVMFYLTSDLSTPLTRNPRIVELKHFVQQGLRSALSRFIGAKNLPKIRAQIRDTAGAYFRDLRQRELIVNYTGVDVRQNESDPSTLDVEAYYSPVFPINWIVVTLNLRTSV